VSEPGTVFNAPGEAAVSSLPHTDADFVARISVTGRLLDASSVGVWRRYAGPWSPGADGPGSAIQLGTVSCVYDSPSRYSVTVFRVSLTIFGLHQEWTTQLLCDEAFAYAGLTLASCPRATLMPVPPPLRDY